MAVGPVETKLDPDDVRAMSPRRTSEDIEALGKEARDELKKCVFFCFPSKEEIRKNKQIKKQLSKRSQMIKMEDC